MPHAGRFSSCATAVAAATSGDLLANLCSGMVDESTVSVDAWQQPLSLSCRLGVKLTNGRFIFSSHMLRQALSSASSGRARGGAEQPSDGRVQSSHRPPLPQNEDSDYRAVADLDALLAGLLAPATQQARRSVAFKEATEGSEASTAGPPTFIGRPAVLQRPKGSHSKPAQSGTPVDSAALPAGAQQQSADDNQSGSDTDGAVQQEGSSSMDEAAASSSKPSGSKCRRASNAEPRRLHPAFEALSGSDTEAVSGACEGRTSEGSRPSALKGAAPRPRMARAQGLLAASRIGQASSGRSLVEVWQQSSQQSTQACRAQSSVLAQSPGMTASDGQPQPARGLPPAALLERFPGLQQSMAEYVVQVRGGMPCTLWAFTQTPCIWRLAHFPACCVVPFVQQDGDCNTLVHVMRRYPAGMSMTQQPFWRTA